MQLEGRFDCRLFGLSPDVAEALHSAIMVLTNAPFAVLGRPEAIGELRPPLIIMIPTEDPYGPTVKATIVIPEYRDDGSHFCDWLVTSEVPTDHFQPILAAGPIGEA